MSKSSKKDIEFAPGIPRPVIKPVRTVPIDGPNETWVLGVEEHRAARAGKHYDVRLVDPKEGVAHSWALPKAEWPQPGERRKLVRTFTHDIDYALRTGKWKIDTGYGKGEVKKLVLEPIELIKAEPRIIKFQRYGPGQKVEEYAILRFLGKDDILYNMTKHKDVWIPEKPKYKDTAIDSLDPGDDDEVWQAKIDGAHTIIHLPKAGYQIRVYSVRKSKRTGEAIEHTPRLPDWHRLVTPSGYGGTVLRAEIYGVDRDGKPIPVQQLAGLLNKNVWDARMEMERRGIRLKLAPFDVVKWRGRPAEYADYRDKLKWLKEVASYFPDDVVELPDTAKSADEKKRLLRQVRKGAHHQTGEGVVVRRLEGAHPPIRAKLTEERDATIVGFTKGKGKYSGGKGVGGFIVKDEVTGATSVVGTGLPDRLRRAAAENPSLFKGVKIKVKVQQVFPSGSYRAPRFISFHPDKNDPEKLEELAKFAALDDAEMAEAQMSDEDRETTKAVDWIARQLVEHPIASAAATGAGSVGVAAATTPSHKDLDRFFRALSDYTAERPIERFYPYVRAKLRAEIKRSGVPASVTASRLSDGPVTVSTISLRRGLEDQVISLPPGKAARLPVAFHELGHAKITAAAPRLYTLLSRMSVPARLFGPLVTGAGAALGSPAMLAAGAVIGGAPLAAKLLDEAAASASGLGTLSRTVKDPKALAAAGRLYGAALRTYLRPALRRAASRIGIPATAGLLVAGVLNRNNEAD